VNVRMAGKHEIDPAPLEDGHDVRAHLDELLFAVAVVRTFGVRRMMKESYEPIGFGFFEVLLQPTGHERGGTPIEIVRIQTNEMRAAVIEGVKGFEAGCNAAGFTASRKDIGVVVRTDAVGAAGSDPFVITHGRPADDVA